MIAKDKWGHFKVGVLVALVTFLVLRGIGVIWGVALVWSVIAANVAGISKEVYDSFHPDKHTVELLDYCFTVWGGIAVAAVVGLGYVVF